MREDSRRRGKERLEGRAFLHQCGLNKHTHTHIHPPCRAISPSTPQFRSTCFRTLFPEKRIRIFGQSREGGETRRSAPSQTRVKHEKRERKRERESKRERKNEARAGTDHTCSRPTCDSAAPARSGPPTRRGCRARRRATTRVGVSAWRNRRADSGSVVGRDNLGFWFSSVQFRSD